MRNRMGKPKTTDKKIMKYSKSIKYSQFEMIAKERDTVRAIIGSEAALAFDYLREVVAVENGYYIKWTEEAKRTFAFQFQFSLELVSELIDTLINIGFFDEHLFIEHRVLTSAKLQEQFMRVVKYQKWTDVMINPALNLLEETKQESSSELADNEMIQSFSEFSEKIPDSKGKSKSKVKEESTVSTFYQNPTNILNTESKQVCVRVNTHTREENFCLKNDLELLDPANETKAGYEVQWNENPR